MPQALPIGFGQVIHSISLADDPEPMALTYGVKFEPNSPTTSGQATVDALRNAFVTHLGGLLATGYMHRQTELKVQFGAALEVFLNNETANFTGTTNALPQNSALLVHKRSNTAGRRHRGRLYIPGVNETNVDPKGVVAEALRSAWQTGLNAFLQAVVDTVTLEAMVIFHSGLSGAVLPPPTPVSTLAVDPRIATQRRRLRP